jgi:hypothetical protein
MNTSANLDVGLAGSEFIYDVKMMEILSLGQKVKNSLEEDAGLSSSSK